jgi:hypothetical protein
MGKYLFLVLQQIKISEERILSAQNGVEINLKSALCTIISNLD